MANPNYLEKIKVGILTFGDGRDFLQKPLTPVNEKFTKELEARLKKDGFQVVVGRKVLWKNSIAEAEGRRMTAQGCHAVIFNFAVWAWPQYARVAAQFCPQPILMFSNVNPQYPGLVGMLANAGSLDQVGIKFYKTFGDINDKTTYAQVKSRLLAIAAYNGLKGLTYGLFGGRALGIDTAVADPALWMKKFGIDVDHVDQMELVRRAELHVAKGTKVEAALKYLTKRLKKIHWTKPDAEFRLTENLLRKQLGMYYAAYDLTQEFGYSFCGIKGQRELTEHYVTADVAEAFLNDPYHPDGTPKEPIICSTEADMDAALTMKILNLLSGEPALFADIRHYHADLDAWDLCNSGEHATFFAAREPQARRVPARGLLLPRRRRERLPLRRARRGDARAPDAQRRYEPLPDGDHDGQVHQARRREGGEKGPGSPGQLAARLLQARQLLAENIRRRHELQPHPRRVRQLARRARDFL